MGMLRCFGVCLDAFVRRISVGVYEFEFSRDDGRYLSRDIPLNSSPFPPSRVEINVLNPLPYYNPRKNPCSSTG